MIPEKDIKRYLANVKNSLAVKGLNMKKRSVVYGRKYLRGQMTSEDIIQDITKYITKKNRKFER
ncbi:MAG: hypothetical protein M0T74_13610 [Desulfitobacterium hafniense]|nr:hypothetical protein [Desulfitobacterium hafniense]